LVLLATTARAEDGRIVFRSLGTNTQVRVLGSGNEDWRFQTSTNLATWNTATNLGVLIAGDTGTAPWRTWSNTVGPRTFYRALRTGGLYDRTLLRTMSLTFTQANWASQLTSARTAGTNVYCSLMTLDNGATNAGVGARYRGNTSFTGLAGNVPVKKSINLDLAFSLTNADLMGYNTVNLNNAYQDETLMRESLYFNLMRRYTVCPAGCLIRLYINGANWGVYSFAQQENADLIREYFPSTDGDRWRAPNMPAAGGGGGGGGFTSGTSALLYLGNTNIATYTNNYELKSDYHTNAYPRLIRAIYVFNTATTAQLRAKAEEVLAVDRWLWFLALENIFADDDSYWNKGADYMMYFEPESGRLHPVEHDGNEAFVAGDASLSPTQGLGNANRPVISRLLGVAELKQRYLAHMRTALQEFFDPALMTPLINEYVAVSVAAIAADPKKGYTAMTTYTNDLLALKTFVTNRYKYLTTHAELTPLAPVIAAVYAPTTNLDAGQIPSVTARVTANRSNGIDSVWLYHRGKPYGAFARARMFDDGAHGDADAEDGLFGAATTNYPAGAKVRFYIEARSANTTKAASFSPPRAEQETYDYRVTLVTAPNTPVVINELMADNRTALPDPQGQFDDWIELHNITETTVDLTGRYLSDESNNPRKWPFPAGTTIPAGGYLIVWADEDGTDTPGLHASFKLAQDGEEVFLIDTDA
jgi:spore coat protein CotH